MSQSQVISFQERKAEKQATEQASKILGLTEMPELETYALEVLLKGTAKINFFSGDIEPGEARTSCLCPAEAVVEPATVQRFEVEMLGGTSVRLRFDGDFMYILYLHDFLTADLVQDLVDNVREEQKINAVIESFKRERFNQGFDKILGR